MIYEDCISLWSTIYLKLKYLFDKTIQCTMSFHKLYEYTCHYKFSGNGNKEFYHSFYCWRKSSFLIHTDAAFSLLLTKAMAMLQNEYYYKIFYYSMVNIWLSFPLFSQFSKEDFTLMMLIYWQVRKAKFQFFVLKEWMASPQTPDCIVIL